MPISLEKFIDSLSTTGLLAPDEVTAIRADVGKRDPQPDVETLARELVRAGTVTAFQATAIYHGKGKGLVCGEYVLLEKIGAGGMGQVYKARHKRMNRIVAVKLLAAHIKAADKQRAVRRFYKEVELAARLVHPNIVTAYDAGESQGLHYMVMEYVAGQDVASCLKPDKKLSVDQALAIVLQAARGLAYAHSQGIVHRDIKPSNLLMDHEGNVKILDMGLARVEAELSGDAVPARDGLTQSGEVMGTLDYMAPEQARNTRDADARSDIYSLGCTLFRLIAGRVPYSGESTVEKIMAHYERPIPGLSEHCDRVSRKLEQTYERMLAKQPGDRFQSMNDVITALEACRASIPETEHEPLVTDEPPPAEAIGASFLSKAGASGLGLGPLSMTPIPLPLVGGSDPQVRTSSSSDRHVPAPRPAWKEPQALVLGSLSVVVLALIAAITFLLVTEDKKPGSSRTPVVRINDSPDVESTTTDPEDKQPSDQPVSSDASSTTSGGGTKTPASATNTSGPEAPSFPDLPVLNSDTTAAVKTSPSTPATTSAGEPPTSATMVVKTVETTTAASNVQGAGRPGVRVDLLRAVDLKRDLVSGIWTAEGAHLLAPSTNEASRLQLPYAPPPSYEVRMVIQPINFNGWWSLGMTVGSSRVCYLLDEGSRTSGLDMISGARSSRNETTVTGLPGIGQGDQATVLCRIRPDRVVVMLNGRTVVDWTGDSNRLSSSSTYDAGDKSKLSLVTNGSGFRISKLEVVPLGGHAVKVPEPSLVAEAASKINDLVGPSLPANADARRKSQRAASMHYQASLVGDDDALCYALLTEAIKLAIAADDVALLNYLSDDLVRCFDTKSDAPLIAGLVQISAVTRPPADRRELGIRMLELSSETCLAEQYENTLILADATANLLAKTKEADLQREAQAQELEAREFQRLATASQAAREQLATDPDAAAANLAAGQYLAIGRSDWDAALPLLAKSGDAETGTAARLEIQAAKDPSRAAEIGTAWVGAAEKATGAAKTVYAEHARMWLARGAASLSPQNLSKLLNRFKKLDTDARRASGMAFLKRHPLRALAYNGHWYQFVPRTQSWHEARQHCQDLGGDLVTLETPAECQWVYSFATAQFGTPDAFDFWLGATDQGHENLFSWVNGAPFQFTQWDTNEPDNDATQDAVLASRRAVGSPDFRWQDTASSARKAFICEWER